MESTESKIIQSALEALAIKGFQKVTLNDIAKQAKVSRPTVYSYFKDKDELIQSALLHSSLGIAEDLIKHAEKFDKASTRIVEAMLYALKRIPQEAHLALLADPEVVQLVNEFALVSKEGNALCQGIFKVALMGKYKDEAELNELIEVCVRLLLSLLTMKSARKRTVQEQRLFLERRLLPALGLR